MAMETNTVPDSDAILDELSKEKVNELIPVIVVVSFLLIFGLIGNGSVLLFFWRKRNDSVASFFIFVLAVVDTLVCLTISLIIMDLSSQYKYTSNAGCKLHVFSKFVTAFFSVLLLVTIAIHRYRSLCCPFKRQLTLHGARIAVIVDIIIAVILAVPMLFLYETTDMEVPNKHNVTVIGSGCISTRDKELRKFLTAMNYIFFILFVIFSIVLIVLYSLQGKVIYRYNKSHARLKSRFMSKENETNSTSLSHEQGHDKTAEKNPDSSIELSTIEKSNDVKLKESTVAAGSTSQTGINENDEPKADRKEQNKAEKRSKDMVSSIKITVMFLIITVGFIVCFTPYLAYALRRSFTRSLSSTTKTTTTTLVSATVVNQFLTNSYLLNSVINPIIYGFVHTEFRMFLNRFLCCCRNNRYAF